MKTIGYYWLTNIYYALAVRRELVKAGVTDS